MKNKIVGMQYISVEDIFRVLEELEDRFGDSVSSDILAQVPEMATDHLMACAVDFEDI